MSVINIIEIMLGVFFGLALANGVEMADRAIAAARREKEQEDG